MNRIKKLVFLAFVVALAVCAVPAAIAQTSAFPVEIEHAYGSTTVEAKPERIATVFDSNPDAVLALKIVPVGVSTIGYGVVEENGLPYWVNDAFEQLGATANVYDDTDGISWEQVSDSDPDLIPIQA